MMRILVKLGSRVPLAPSAWARPSSSLPDEQIDAILKVKGLPRITPAHDRRAETMWAALKVIRHRGYSFDDKEHAAGHALRRGDGLRRIRGTAGRDLAGRSVVPPARRAHQATGPHRRAHRGRAHAEAGRALAASVLSRRSRAMSRAFASVPG